MGLINLGNEVDPVLTRLVDEDKVRWWKKPNLRLLYLLLYPTCMGIEITSGFDSQMINGLQLITAWNKCSSTLLLPQGWETNKSRLRYRIHLSERRSELCCCRSTFGYHRRIIQSWCYPRGSYCAVGSAEMGKTLVYFPRFSDSVWWFCPPGIFREW